MDMEDLNQEAPSTPDVKRWPLGERIGSGAFGDAFIVTDPKTRKQYVLKRVRMARQNDWQRAATKQEIKLGAMLAHPYVVEFVKSWIRDGHEVNIVYGYCEQGDLQTAVKRRKGKHFDEVQLRRWLAQMLLALQYLQTKHVLHRDLKTCNIFVTADGDVQIGDFGLATLRETDTSSSHDQSIVGTPHFMSPEVLSRKKYDYKTDVWSIGCVFYELSAFRPPFNAFNLNGLVSKITKGALPALPVEYSNDWSSLIKSMLKKDADKRPSVEELLMAAPIREEVLWAQARARVLQPCVATPTALSLMEAGLEVEGGATPRTPDAVKRASFDQPDVQQAANPVSTRDAPTMTSEQQVVLASADVAFFMREGSSRAAAHDISTSDVPSGSIRTRDSSTDGLVKPPVARASSARALGANSNRTVSTKAGGSGAQQETPMLAVRAPPRPVAPKHAVPVSAARPARPAVPPRAAVQGRAAVMARVPRNVSASEDASAKEKAHARVPLDPGGVRAVKQRASSAQGAAVGIARHRHVAATDRLASVPVLPRKPALPPAAQAAGLLDGGPAEQQAVAVAAAAGAGHTEDPGAVPPGASPVAVPASDAAGLKQGMRGTNSSGGSDALAAVSACVPASKAEQLMYNNELYQSRRASELGALASASGKAAADADGAVGAFSQLKTSAVDSAAMSASASMSTPEAAAMALRGMVLNPADLASGSCMVSVTACSGQMGSRGRHSRSGLSSEGKQVKQAPVEFLGFSDIGASATDAGAADTPPFPFGIGIHASDPMSVSTASQSVCKASLPNLQAPCAVSGNTPSSMSGVSRTLDLGAPSAANTPVSAALAPDPTFVKNVSHAAPAGSMQCSEGVDSVLDASASADRLETLERVLAVCHSLHGMRRWTELGVMLSSAAQRSPRKSAYAQDVALKAFKMGDTVIAGSRRGTKAVIRYYGPCHWADGLFVGLELDNPDGKHNGTIDGVTYFRCPPMTGIFVRSSVLKPCRDQ